MTAMLLMGHKDVQTIRSALSFPQDFLSVPTTHPLWKRRERIVKPDKLRQSVEGDAASQWLRIHQDLPQFDSEFQEVLLSTEDREIAEASAQVDFSQRYIPDWLKRSPTTPDSDDPPIAPIEWAAARLAERHRLPWIAVTNLKLYILTQDPSWLHIDFASALVSDDSVHGGLSFAVNGIDEFTTKGDWDRVWDRYIDPQLERLWEQRGMNPKGSHGPDIETLRERMPLYALVVADGMSVDSAVAHLVKENSGDWAHLDISSFRRTLRDIDAVLEPVETAISMES
jgi:hypothetical protein